MKWKFEGALVVEASNEEDALNKIGGRMSVISRHLGNGEKLADNAPFFTLTQTDEDADAEALVDPIVAARRAAEEAAAEAAAEQNEGGA